jgi:hypothetical protein
MDFRIVDDTTFKFDFTGGSLSGTIFFDEKSISSTCIRAFLNNLKDGGICSIRLPCGRSGGNEYIEFYNLFDVLVVNFVFSSLLSYNVKMTPTIHNKLTRFFEDVCEKVEGLEKKRMDDEIV